MRTPIALVPNCAMQKGTLGPMPFRRARAEPLVRRPVALRFLQPLSECGSSLFEPRCNLSPSLEAGSVVQDQPFDTDRFEPSAFRLR